MAVARWQQRQYAAAEVLCRGALARSPDLPDAQRLLADILDATGRSRDAIIASQRAVELAPDDVPALTQLATMLLRAGRHGEALRCYQRTLALRPDLANAHAGRALALARTGADQEAITAVSRALELDPGAAPMLLHLGYEFLETGRPASAHGAFCRLLAMQPGQTDAELGRVMALIRMNRFDEALPGLEALRAITPAVDYLPGVHFHAQLQCCDWSNYAETAAAIADLVRRGARADIPHAFLAYSESPSDQRMCAQIYVADRCTADTPPLARPPAQAKLKLRIAYLSSDIRDHAVGQLLAGVFEAHDRGRFESYGFSSGPNDATQLRRRLEGSFDHFVDVLAWSDRAIAARMMELGIDIAIDLGGHSSGGRTRVLSFRPAPLQISLLGYPGTLATDYIDYMIADAVVVPAADRSHYAEQLIYMPDSFLPTDAAPKMAAVPLREDAGLPRDAFVYCGFHAPYKISPRLFDAWMRILGAVPDGVLWLREGGQTVRHNLEREAARRGIDPARLIFAPRTATREEHFARFSLAHVFLDTSPYNAHTTAAEALGVAVPIVTLRGSTFAGRVAASILEACGMRELAVETLAEYEQLAIDLARNPPLLAQLQEQLRRARTQAAFFDATRYCRHLEDALIMAWSRHARGESPATLNVERRAS
jgi:predicted O-linked N-acetylglucosamine transferase (SPINDLY family)